MGDDTCLLVSLFLAFFSFFLLLRYVNTLKTNKQTNIQKTQNYINKPPPLFSPHPANPNPKLPMPHISSSTVRYIHVHVHPCPLPPLSLPSFSFLSLLSFPSFLSFFLFSFLFHFFFSTLSFKHVLPKSRRDRIPNDELVVCFETLKTPPEKIGKGGRFGQLFCFDVI